MSLALAEQAAKLWPLDVQSIQLAAHRENAVFRLDAAQGVFALRLHRKGYRTAAELTSELQIMAMLEGNGIAVPKPLRARDGALLHAVEGTHVSVLSWMAGRPLGHSGVALDVPDRIGTFRALGRLIAAMHNAFDAWPLPDGFTRQRWDAEGLLGEAPQWGRFWDNPALTASQQRLMQAARGRMRARFAAGAFDQGLIHADMVCENVLLHDGALTIIDFDDSGFGFRLQDLATALVKFESEPDFPSLRSALLEGYAVRQRVREKDAALFLLMRHLSYLGWIVPRMATAGGVARNAALIARAVPLAEEFLASG